MKFRIFVLCALATAFTLQTFAQMSQPRGGSDFSITKSRSYFPVRNKATKEQKKQLLPNAEDLTKYAPFLAQPKTGIFRLFPDSGCAENALVVRVDEVCLNAIPESSFYSFRKDQHTAEILADIRLKNNHLVSDGMLAQSILVNLGDTELGAISLDTEGLRFLNDYVPNSSGREAQKQFKEMLNGVREGKHEYRKALPVVENSTYALRVIAYRGSIYRSTRGFVLNLLEGDKRMDLTLAFKVVRKEKDGSVTLLWKELRRGESPKFKFPKRNTSR